MRTVLLPAVSAASTLVLAMACGGTTTGIAHSEGSESGGTSSVDGGASGGADAGGTGGVGAGGSTGTGGTSGGSVSITFKVSGARTYCHHECTSPSIVVRDSTGSVLSFSNLCRADCATCVMSLCPPTFCPPDGADTGAALEWDGRYYATSTCGAGKACLEPRVAEPGKYTATYCTTPGTVTGPDGGFPQCVPSGPETCATVEFDYPSSTPVTADLGP